MRDNDLRIIKTKKALQEAILNLLENKKLENISITEICKEANINRGTFYLHYNQIEDILVEFFEELMKDLSEAYYEPYKHASVIYVNELNPSHIRIFHHVKKYSKFYKIAFSRNASINYYFLLYEKIKSLFSEFRQEEFQNGINSELYLAYQANAIIGLIMDWCENNFQYSVDEMNHQLVLILNHKNNLQA